ncbi:type I restriction endonuclease subunit R [Methanonatronarchaeum thermophilum]|uniref:type I restriction endonuclease subunit R n=1 Tax=Methanonatronarchaeum thermophilum TaxID=1927129 RepID=UPI00191BC9F1|nr:type I restriction endonuclease subunit R [Methanonatronarchaeum thermophilum]
MSLSEWSLSERPAIEVFEDLGYEYREGGEISPAGESSERGSFSDVVLRDRLRRKLVEFNSHIPEDVIDTAVSELLGYGSPKLIKNNREFHENLVEGIDVVYERGGEEIGDKVKVIDFEDPGNNDFLVTNQFSIKIGDNPRRIPDILVFVNGLPIAILENKDPTSTTTSIKKAYEQVTEKYKNDIPDLFNYNEFIVVLDENNARIGCLEADWEWFQPWKYIEEEGDKRPEYSEAETLIRGVFSKNRLIDLIENFIVFNEKEGRLNKVLSAYHQYYAVKKAVETTKNTVPNNDRNKIGLVWHTQGSGKSYTMVFYTKKTRNTRELGNPTFVFVTDRTSLDDQLHRTFTNVGYRTEWAQNITDLREKLDRQYGGLIFTTIQKFQTKKERYHETSEEKFPTVNRNSNVIVIADEAHRSQFKKLGRNLRRALPNASFLGFTATPIEKEDRSCLTTFGEYISQYTIDQSEEDGSTVPIYYESRLAKLKLRNDRIEKKSKELLEAGSEDLKNEMVQKWTRLRKIIENNDERLKTIAQDIVNHFNGRPIEGKGIILAISRKSAVKYKKYIEEIDEAPEVDVVITDPGEYLDEYKDENDLKTRFKDPEDPLKLIVVHDKWTTGFDCPPLHTMYIDRPMKNHNLLQAVGRVNRTYKDKSGGLIVDYIGIADNLKKALDKYTKNIQETAMEDLDRAIKIMHQKHNKTKNFLKETDFKNWQEKEGLELQRLFNKAQNEILETEQKTENFMNTVAELNKVFSLVSPNKEAIKIESDVVFFRALKKSLNNILTPKREKTYEQIDSVMKELVSEGVTVEDIIEVTGLAKWENEQAVLSKEFMQDVEEIEFENLQLRMLERLLRNEINSRKKQNLAKYESFEKKLEETISKYNKKVMSTQEVIKELQNYANEIQQEETRTKELDLTGDELAFYDAINSNTEKNIEQEKLTEIATKIKNRLKDKTDIDWTSRDEIKAKMKSEVKKILRTEGFTHKEYEPLVNPIVEQAELLYGET